MKAAPQQKAVKATIIKMQTGVGNLYSFSMIEVLKRPLSGVLLTAQQTYEKLVIRFFGALRIHLQVQRKLPNMQTLPM